MSTKNIDLALKGTRVTRRNLKAAEDLDEHQNQLKRNKDQLINTYHISLLESRDDGIPPAELANRLREDKFKKWSRRAVKKDKTIKKKPIKIEFTIPKPGFHPNPLNILLKSVTELLKTNHSKSHVAILEFVRTTAINVTAMTQITVPNAGDITDQIIDKWQQSVVMFNPKKKAAAKKTKAKAKVASSTADQPGPSGLQQQVAPSQDRSVDDEQHQLVIDEAMVDQVMEEPVMMEATPEPPQDDNEVVPDIESSGSNVQDGMIRAMRQLATEVAKQSASIKVLKNDQALREMAASSAPPPLLRTTFQTAFESFQEHMNEKLTEVRDSVPSEHYVEGLVSGAVPQAVASARQSIETAIMRQIPGAVKESLIDFNAQLFAKINPEIKRLVSDRVTDVVGDLNLDDREPERGQVVPRDTLAAAVTTMLMVSLVPDKMSRLLAGLTMVVELQLGDETRDSAQAVQNLMDELVKNRDNEKVTFNQSVAKLMRVLSPKANRMLRTAQKMLRSGEGNFELDGKNIQEKLEDLSQMDLSVAPPPPPAPVQLPTTSGTGGPGAAQRARLAKAGMPLGAAAMARDADLVQVKSYARKRPAPPALAQPVVKRAPTIKQEKPVDFESTGSDALDSIFAIVRDLEE